MHNLIKPIESSELADALGLQFVGEKQSINNISSLDSASKGSLCFATKNVSGIVTGSTCLAKKDCLIFDGLILCENPRYEFTRALNYLINNQYISNKKFTGVISSNANVHPTAIIDEGASIGDGCIIGPYVHIHSNVVMNNCCSVGAYTSIGHAGFSYERHENNISARMPHLGKVVIGNNVEIGIHCSISRGVLQDTVIGDDVKIDDQSYVAHNVKVGRGSLLMSGSRLNGRVAVGEFCWIGTGAVLKEGVSVGANVIIGMSSCVINDVRADVTVAGNPSRLIKK